MAKVITYKKNKIYKTGVQLLRNNKLPSKFVLTKKPKKYLVQGFSHCGAYSVKGILDAFGKDRNKHPKNYHTNLLSKITGSGFTKSYYVDMLRLHGLYAKGENAEILWNKEKLVLLKKMISKNFPVMLCIGNGYTKTGRYNPIKASLIGHWITVWGYDDTKQEFYVYDSAVPKKNYDKNIPVGNKKRTYSEILRDWKGSLTTKFIGFGEYYFIKIKSVDKNE